MNSNSTPNTPVPGQRWISPLEPELGLGVIESVDNQYVRIFFPACEEERQYALESSPLNRVQFKPGATIRSRKNRDYTVTDVSESGGLLTYQAKQFSIPEQELHDGMTDRSPVGQLIQGQASDNYLFELRLNAIKQMFHWRKSPVRGLFGAKIELIPHQLFVAHEISNRHHPRVLLADEVGLGKTIEACLILNRLLVCGRAHRVLILLPGALVNQWFVELLRRFNLWFSIFDEERCRAIEVGHPGFNPFEDDQLLIADINWLAESPKRTSQVVQAPWDLLIVDEAHHIEWKSGEPSAQYQLTQALAKKIDSLLLLTATPQQLGLESHFARLHLLDPVRFPSLESFKTETDQYKTVAILCAKLMDNATIEVAELERFPCSKTLLAKAKSMLAKGKMLSSQTRDELIRELADRHGTGRVLFRNTRKVVRGFPKRLAKLATLPAATLAKDISTRQTEFSFDIGYSEHEPKYYFDQDARIGWLLNFLQDHPAEKALLICRTKNKATSIEEAIKKQSSIKTGVFHEGLSLIQRDRNAAWFAEEDGARLLICSEIGSEGRNFQFCRHLILFDLPLNPELLEQRIGRLDRIGQKKDIQIHVPYASPSSQEALAMWLHHGLDAFQKSIPGGQSLLIQFKERLYRSCIKSFSELPKLIKDTKVSQKKLIAELKEGADRLLEINSHSRTVSNELVREIQAAGDSPDLEQLTLQLFDFMGLDIEDIGPRSYRLTNTKRLPLNLPGHRDGVAVITFDRNRAISRDDLMYITQDHPILSACIDQLLGLSEGTAVFAHWQSHGTPTLLMESIHVLECVAPAKLNADRFLPPTPIRTVINHHGKAEVDKDGKFTTIPRSMRNAPAHLIPDIAEIKQRLKPMTKASESIAIRHSDELKKTAIDHMNKKLFSEIQRLKTLAKVNKTVRPEELPLLIEEQISLEAALKQSQLRLDSIRLIWKGNLEELEKAV